jgi:hypothetical protein
VKLIERRTIALDSDFPGASARTTDAKTREFVVAAVRNPANSWSIGTFGVVGEFMWNPSESVSFLEDASTVEVRSERGAMRISMSSAVLIHAYQSLWGDGEAWTSGVAFCLPSVIQEKRSGFHRLGSDSRAMRHEEQDAFLFDLGIGVGHTAICIRTRDPDILAAAQQMEGEDLLSHRGDPLFELLRKKSPVRVMTSPAGRIEVYSPIPPEGGRSPSGPHTHLLPRLAILRRTHSANVPIPESLQPVLTMHPRSPWRTAGGERVSYDHTAATDFDEIISEFGDERAKEVSRSIELAVSLGQQPHTFPFPRERHLRIQARVVLRRLAQEARGRNIASWLALYD